MTQQKYKIIAFFKNDLSFYRFCMAYFHKKSSDFLFCLMSIYTIVNSMDRLHRIEQSVEAAGGYEAKRISEDEQKRVQRKAKTTASPTTFSLRPLVLSALHAFD